jgi:hypothetical protein
VYVQDKRSDRPGGDVYAGGMKTKWIQRHRRHSSPIVRPSPGRRRKKEDGIKR